MKGLRLKNPPVDWEPGREFRPGELKPGELCDGLDGDRGAEKPLLPRLPKDFPPPALAQALVSMNVASPKKNTAEKTKARNNLEFCLISHPLSGWERQLCM
jgi:hypothetical protein